MFTGLIAGMMLAVGSAWGLAYGTLEARREIALLLENVPPIMAGIAGPIVHPETMGGFLTYKYGPFFAFLAGLWSILALSGTLAAEARRGSLDLVAAAPFGKRRIALEKLAAHVTAMASRWVFPRGRLDRGRFGVRHPGARRRTSADGSASRSRPGWG